MNHADLADELMSDPEGLGYAAHVAAGDDLALVGILNLPADRFEPPKGWTRPTVIYRASLLLWAAEGPRASLAAVAADDQSPAQAVAQVALDMLRGSVEYLDLGLDGVAAMLGLLVSGGAITQDQADALHSLGRSPCSRAEALFGPGVVVDQADVSFALRGQR